MVGLHKLTNLVSIINLVFSNQQILNDPQITMNNIPNAKLASNILSHS